MSRTFAVILVSFLCASASLANGGASSQTSEQLSTEVPSYTLFSSPECKKALSPSNHERLSYLPRLDGEVSKQKLQVSLKKLYSEKIIQNIFNQLVFAKLLGADTRDILNKMANVIACNPTMGAQLRRLNAKANEAIVKIKTDFPGAGKQYAIRLALALVEGELLASRAGLTLSLTAEDKDRLNYMRLLYPQLNAVGASESAQQILLALGDISNLVSNPLKGGWLGQNSYGLQAEVVRVLAYDERTISVFNSLVDQLLIENSKLSVTDADLETYRSRSPGPFDGLSLRGRLYWTLFTKPLNGIILSHLQKVSINNLSKALEAISDLCAIKFCEMTQLSSEMTAGYVMSQAPQIQTGLEYVLCKECAVNDLSSWYKFKEKYGMMMSFGISMSTTGLCMLLPPYGCLPGVMWGVYSAGKKTHHAFHAYEVFSKKSNFIAGGLLSSVEDVAQMDKEHRAVYIKSFEAAVSIANTAWVTLDTFEVFKEAREVSKVSTFLATRLSGHLDGHPEDLAVAMTKHAMKNHEFKEKLIKLFEQMHTPGFEKQLTQFASSNAIEIQSVAFNFAHPSQAHMFELTQEGGHLLSELLSSGSL